MGERIVIDFTKELPFDVTPWTVTAWDGDASLLGIRSNTITHNQSTSFEIRAKFEYIKVDYIVSSETNSDKLYIYIDGTYVLSTGTAETFYEKTFEDGNEHIIKFSYIKDGSVNKGYDAAFIKGMTISTVDDSLVQYARLYGVVAESGKVYTLSTTDEIVEVSPSLEAMTKDLYLSFTKNKELFNMESDLFGKRKTIYVCENINKDPSVRYRCLRNPEVLKMKHPFSMDYEYVLGISTFTVDVVQSETDIAKFVFSLDGGSTWQYFDTTSILVTLPILDRENVLLYGHTPDEMRDFTVDQLNQLYATKSLMIAMVLKPDDLASTLSVNDVTCRFKIKE